MRSLAVAAVVLAVSLPALGADYAWVEGERPLKANFKWKPGGAKVAGILSDDKMLYQDLPEGAGRPKLTEQTLDLEYELNVPKDARYDVWLRIGFEWIRPKVSWRLNGQGRWTTVGLGGQPAAPRKEEGIDYHRLSTNVKCLGFWAEVAWWNLGAAELKAGANRLELRFSAGDTDTPLLALDVVALVSGGWTPEGKLKPGQEYDGPDDRKAAAQVFELPKPTGPANRAAVALTGLWQVARYDDPDMDQHATEPLTVVPKPDLHALHWMGIQVPLSLWNHPETAMGHRVIYRTRLHVPAEHRGRGFYLHFSGTNWLVAVLIDGKLAGTHNGVWIPWDLDVSRFIEPGKTHELMITVKGPWYAVDTEHLKRGDLDHLRNRPRDAVQHNYWIAPIYPSTKGEGDGRDYGLVNKVALWSTGAVYTEDVFIKPSVARGKLENEVTVRNTTDQPRRLQVLCEAVDDKDQRVEKSFGPVDLSVPAHATATARIEGAWDNPRLWWPKPDPDLYRLRITVLEGHRPVDIKEELFGFREVTVKGTGIYINGVRRNLWNWVDPHGPRTSAEAYLKNFREENNRFLRFSTDNWISKFIPAREDRLEYWDRNGVAGRLCSMIDGMFINYVLVDRKRDEAKNQIVATPNAPVWEAFERHIAQLTKAYRNHPSVIMYQIENELVYINGQNRYGDHIDQICECMNNVANAGKKNDPTRPYTVGGAGDLTGRLEVTSPHYAHGPVDWYPGNAYTMEKTSDHTSRWPWAKDKPWIEGESAFAGHIEYASYTIGDQAFRSAEDAAAGKARFLRMLYNGYRWAGAAGFCPWDNLWQFEDSKKAFSDLCVIPRRQTSRLYAGQENKVLVKVMNDTLSRAPVQFQWSYEVGGSRVAGETRKLDVEPGFGVEQTLAVRAPATDKRLEGVLRLKASQPGATDYVDERLIPVLPAATGLKVPCPVLVLDRSNKLAAFFRRGNMEFESIEGIARIKGKSGLLVVGPDTLTAKEAYGQELLAFASRGNKVIVLEQGTPVGGSNLPAPLQLGPSPGGYAHPQALGTPVFRDLGKEDLIDWAAEHPTYREPYLKPSQGGRSLAQCGRLLPYSCLLEFAARQGVMVLCQLRVGANLGLDPAADVLLRNLVEHYAAFRPSPGVAAIYAPDEPPSVPVDPGAKAVSTGRTKKPLTPGVTGSLAENIIATGALCQKVAGLAEALDASRFKAAVIYASPKTLAELASMKDKFEAFQQAGHWIMLAGLTPEGLDAFNRLMGTQHMIRPFRLERVTLQNPDFPLVSTLGNRDVALFGGPLQHGKMWVSHQTFSWVIDGANIAPFCQMPGGPEDPHAPYVPLWSDHDPFNLVNGLVRSDHWRYIKHIGIPQPEKPAEKPAAGEAKEPAPLAPPSAGDLLAKKLGLPETLPKPLVFKLRRPEILGQINIWNNVIYWTNKDVEIVFDEDPATAVKVELPDSEEMVPIRLQTPREVRRSIALVVRSWRGTESGKRDLPLTGIDNLQFLRSGPPKAVLLDSVGGLVAFPRGAGGVLLNQIRYIDRDPFTDNAAKKAYLTGTILQNMGVGSKSASVAVPGLNVKYTPLRLLEKCNAYLVEREGRRALFGLKGLDLAELKVGPQYFNEVLFKVEDYSTAPVPDVIVVAPGNAPRKELPRQVQGVPVNAKADVLFFLHAAGLTRPVTSEESATYEKRPERRPEVARYVIHYDDGQSLVVPVVLRREVDHLVQTQARPLPGAMVAWTSPNVPKEYERDGKELVLYSMKFANPRSDVPIKTIDIATGEDAEGKPTNRGSLAVVAITLGAVQDK